MGLWLADSLHSAACKPLLIGRGGIALNFSQPLASCYGGDLQGRALSFGKTSSGLPVLQPILCRGPWVRYVLNRRRIRCVQVVEQRQRISFGAHARAWGTVRHCLQGSARPAGCRRAHARRVVRPLLPRLIDQAEHTQRRIIHAACASTRVS